MTDSGDPTLVPFGFWLRSVDKLIDVSMDRVLGESGVTRKSWQLLSLIKRNQDQQLTSLREGMRVSEPDVEELEFLIDSLTKGHLIAFVDGAWVLTGEGESELRLLAGIVDRHRAEMFKGISDEDYRTTVETMARIVSNLDPRGTERFTFA